MLVVPCDSLVAPQATQTVVSASLLTRQTVHDQDPGFRANFAIRSELFLLVPIAVVSCSLELFFVVIF